MRGPPFSSVLAHPGGECGLISSFNKMRAVSGLRPLVLEEFRVEAAAKKKQVTTESLARAMEKECKEMRALIAGLVKRVEVLELSKGSKKRKGAPAPAPLAPPAASKKARQANSTAGKKGAGPSTSSGSAQAGDKGKGKKKTPGKKQPESGARIEEVE
jgi:hypothetical protein